MKIHRDLLFHHGHIADVALARSLARPADAPHGDGGHAPEERAPAPGTEATRPDQETRRQARHAQLIRAMTALSPFR